MSAHATPSHADDSRRVYAFFAVACGITWALDLPMALALTRGAAPPPYALAMAGLGAWGPTLAALVVASRGRRREIFGPWRTSPRWILLALFTPLLLHVPATLLEVALGGEPSQWLYPPVRPEHFVALVMFSFGEELGWRGYAYPRIAALHGQVAGALILGLVWAFWHALMMFALEDGSFDLVLATTTLIELPLYSVIIGWFLLRSGGSLAVAVALHAGGHLDNVGRTPDEEIRIRVLRILVLAIAAGLAARALQRADRTPASSR